MGELGHYRVNTQIKKARCYAGFSVLLGFIYELNWWRRRGSNPRPQVLRHRLYMLRSVDMFNRLLLDRQSVQTAVPLGFSESAPDLLHRDLVSCDA